MIDETSIIDETEFIVPDEPADVPETAPPEPAEPAEPVTSLEIPDEPPAPDVSDPEPALEVISVDELLGRLTGAEESEDDGIETADVAGEIIGDVVDEVIEADPVVGVVETVVENLVDVIGDLNAIEKHTETIQQTLNHPALTTPFEDYTVTEALLLLLLLCVFISACIKMLKGGFSWLR